MEVIIGDIHAEWKYLNGIVQRMQPEIIIQTGDFGYWPSFEQFALSGIKLSKGSKLYFCDGNHEDHWRLSKLSYDKSGVAEVAKNVYYVRRGSVLDIGGRKTMFMGGANSVDKDRRSIGYDWFPEESISGADVERALSYEGRVDMVVSHTGPKFAVDEMKLKIFDIPDASEKALEVIFERFRPERWYFGHFHVHKARVIGGCRFEVLNMVEYVDDCWCELV